MPINTRTIVQTIAGLLTAALCAAGPSATWAHVDNPLLPEGCGSCHVGHGAPNEPMLAHAEEEFCYQCHGSEDDRTKMISEGRLAASVSLADIEREFKKPFRHPVVEGIGHQAGERLPSFKSGATGHAECTDCHNPHQRIGRGKGIRIDVAGYSISGQYLETSLHEYEICLKCHTDYVDVDQSENNLRADFALSVRSQHPVTIGSTGDRLPSLAAGLGEGLAMTCSDCHTSDDANGPRGPHGSNHQFLLSGNYSTDVYADESSYTYEFCYSCHDRFSILSNESFPLHKEHIVGDPINRRPGTSCFTCHASHGSRDNEHLIRFNPKAVRGDATTGLIRYQTRGDGSGECYLQCHGHNHSPAQY